jgi:hypothetical protein
MYSPSGITSFHLDAPGKSEDAPRKSSRADYSTANGKLRRMRQLRQILLIALLGMFAVLLHGLLGSRKLWPPIFS